MGWDGMGWEILLHLISKLAYIIEVVGMITRLNSAYASQQSMGQPQ